MDHGAPKKGTVVYGERVFRGESKGGYKQLCFIQSSHEREKSMKQPNQ